MRIFWYAQKSRFWPKKIKLYSELSYTYPLLFGSKTFMTGQLGDFPGPNMHPHPHFGNFFKSLAVLRIWVGLKYSLIYKKGLRNWLFNEFFFRPALLISRPNLWIFHVEERWRLERIEILNIETLMKGKITGKARSGQGSLVNLHSKVCHPRWKLYKQTSRVMRKPAFCNCEAEQRIYFRYTDSTIPLLSKPKISSLCLSQYSMIVQSRLWWTWSKPVGLGFAPIAAHL